MSQIAIRAALELQLAAIIPALPTAWENMPFAPPDSQTPFQQAILMFADPINPEMGGGYWDHGYMQVNLLYPQGAATTTSAGTALAAARAALVRAAFPKGSSLTHGGIVVTIPTTPSIGNGHPDDDRWFLPIKIQFRAAIFGG